MKVLFSLILSTFLVMMLLASSVFAKSIISRPLGKTKCGLEKCHGLDFSCTKFPPQICTEQYAYGDLCRPYAKCEFKKNNCALVESKPLKECVECLRDCKLAKSSAEISAGEYAMECDTFCRKKLNLSH